MTPKERAKQVYEMACGHGWAVDDHSEAEFFVKNITKAIQDAVEAERESCAKVAESTHSGGYAGVDLCCSWHFAQIGIAKAIRERSK